ncbi:MAG: VCBS repeat-containing protein, partial [Planctomycetes bacterium]|nr:VCBS repeat-containing protein [Planctomycetota bacterium]
DFDRDGDPDLLQRGFTNIRVLGNDGRGTFRGVLAQTTNGNWGGQPWLVADLDGDGFDDLLQRFGNEWFRNASGAGLVLQTLPEWLYDLLPFDGDGDGDPDLIGRNWLGAPLWLRNTAGTFTTAGTAPSGTISGVLAIADCDGDTHDDVLWSAYPTANLQLWRVTGNGVFTTVANAIPASLPPVTAAATADFDGDGDLDIVAGHDGIGPRVSLLANGGTGLFTLVAQPALPIDYLTTFAIADLDADGDADIVARGGYIDAPRLLRNDGGFAFVDATGTGVDWRGLPLPIGADALVADVDRDGDNDVVPFGPPITRVLRNLQRQLAARSDPVRGASWRLEVLQRPIGSSLGSVVLGLTEASPAVPTPFGDLRIAPAGAVLQGLAIVDTYAPVEVLSLPIPNSPAIAGLAVFAQHVAFDGNTIRLGNQVIGTVQ